MKYRSIDASRIDLTLQIYLHTYILKHIYIFSNHNLPYVLLKLQVHFIALLSLYNLALSRAVLKACLH